MNRAVYNMEAECTQALSEYASASGESINILSVAVLEKQVLICNESYHWGDRMSAGVWV